MVTQKKIFALKKRHKIAVTLMLFFATWGLRAQNIAMNNAGTTADPSAVLDMSNNSALGFLMPNVHLANITDVTTIPFPADGLIVYNTNAGLPNGVGFYYWSQTATTWYYIYNSGHLGAGVTSVAMTVPSIFSITGSPITSSGTFGVTLTNENANTIFAGPATGAAAAPTFRALVLADLPTGIPNSDLVNSSITVNAGTNISVTGSPVSLGGTVTISNSGGTVTSVGPAAAGLANTGGSGLYFSSNPITGIGTIGLAATGVTAATYGSATAIPTFTVNAEGQLTSATTVATLGGTVTSVGAGTPGAQTGTSGLKFSTNPITGAGTLSIATAGVSNAMLANTSVNVVPGNGLALTSGSNPVSLGGTIGIGISAPVSIANGGSGTITPPTQYGVIYAGSTTAYASTAAGATGSVLTGNGAAAPTFQSLTGLLGNGYLKNQTTTQTTTNFYTQSAAAGSVGAVIEGAAGQTADLLDVETSTPTIVGKVDASGNLTSQGLTSTGTVNINATGAGVTTIGNGGTGPVIIGNTTGNVGIGTSTPNGLFNVNGIMGIGQSSATAGAATGTLTFYNSTNTGSVSLQGGSLLAANNYTMTLPTAQGAANTALTDNGAGALTWANPSGLMIVNNGLTLTVSNVQLGGALIQNTTVAGTNNAMAFDLGTGSVAGTGTFSITNGGTATPYLYAGSSTNRASVGIGNSVPGSNLLKVSNSTASTGVGNGITMTGQTGAAGALGGAVTIAGGAGGTNASGGSVTISTGASAGTANGANVIIEPTALSGTGTTNGGVAINNTGATPNPSALVDMATNTAGPAGGLLIPRLASNPALVADGLMYYNTTTNCFMFYSSALSLWQSISCKCTTAPTAPTSVNGPASVCVSSSYLFSISPVANASSYQWTVPAGAIITSGQGTATINVTMPSSTGTGTVSVDAINGCGTSSAANLTVTIGAGPTGTGTISGTFTVCPSSAQGYSISGVTGATYYLWTVPAGWTITGGQGTASLTVTTGISGGTLTCTPYSIAGGCPGTIVTSATISNTPAPSAVGAISGPIAGCNTTFVSTANTYTIAPVTGATSYSWSVNNTYATVTASTTNTVIITSAATAGSFTITATAINCGGSTSNTLAITCIAHGTASFVWNGTTNYTNGSVQTWSVPCCVTQVTVTLNGAQGGRGGTGAATYYSNGGLGGKVVGTYNTTGVTSINVYVGGAGQNEQNTTYGLGGYNGGGNGGYDAGSYIGGGGGGASDIRVGGTALANRVAVAGGGGGGGDNYATANDDNGGTGGSTTAANGAGYDGLTQGDAYCGLGATTATFGNSAINCTLTNGALGIGGNACTAASGGGGGGGNYGGGAGDYCGGGGGSNLTTGLTTVTTNSQGTAAAGNGSVSIQY